MKEKPKTLCHITSFDGGNNCAPMIKVRLITVYVQAAPLVSLHLIVLREFFFINVL